MVTIGDRSLSEVVLTWGRDGDSSYILLFGDQTISPVPMEPRSDQVSHKVSALQEGRRYKYSIIASYYAVNSTTYQSYTATSKTHHTPPHSIPPHRAITHIALLLMVLSLT